MSELFNNPAYWLIICFISGAIVLVASRYFKKNKDHKTYFILTAPLVGTLLEMGEGMSSTPPPKNGETYVCPRGVTERCVVPNLKKGYTIVFKDINVETKEELVFQGTVIDVEYKNPKTRQTVLVCGELTLNEEPIYNIKTSDFSLKKTSETSLEQALEPCT